MQAVRNSLRTQQNDGGKAIEYEAGGNKIKLTPAIVKKYLISGDADKVTDQEVMMFMSLCRYSHLNPWTKEAYCIKYGNKAATMVVGKAAFQKRAESNPNFDGMESGVVTFDPETGNVDYKRGALTLPGEQIIGGWADVYRKDRSHPTHCEVSFDEYVGKKADGSINSQWNGKPGVMIRKVAIVTALRDAFPTALEGMYAAEEFGGAESEATFAPAITKDDVARIEEKEGVAISTPTQKTPQAEKEGSARGAEEEEELFS